MMTLAEEKIDVEQLVLSESTNATPEQFDAAIALGLNSGQFSGHGHPAIFNAIVRLRNEGTAPDIVTVRHALGDQLHLVGGDEYLLKVTESPIHMFHFEDHVKVLANLSWRESTADRLSSILDRSKDSAISVDELQNELRATAEASATGERPLPAFVTSGVPFDEFCSEIIVQEYLINRVLSRCEELVFGAPDKTLKTCKMADMAVSLATGTPFLGYEPFSVPKPGRSCLMTLETGKPALQSLCKRIVRARQLNPEDVGKSVVINQELPIIANDWHMRELIKYIDGEGFDAVMIDPAYLTLFDEGSKVQAGNLLEMGPLLRRITEVRKETGVTFVMAHHTRKSQPNLDYFKFRKTTRDDLTQSGFKEWMRQWALLSRKTDYTHDGRHVIHAEFGGSSGHGGEYVVQVDEGKKDNGENQILTDWQTIVTPAGEFDEAAKAAKEENGEAKKDETLERNVVKVRNAMEAEEPGKWFSKNAITQSTPLNDANTGKALFELRRRGEVAMDDSNSNRVKWSLIAKPDKPNT